MQTAIWKTVVILPNTGNIYYNCDVNNLSTFKLSVGTLIKLQFIKCLILSYTILDTVYQFFQQPYEVNPVIPVSHVSHGDWIFELGIIMSIINVTLYSWGNEGFRKFSDFTQYGVDSPHQL